MCFGVFGVFGFFQKKTNVFFGFSRFLVLENLENPKNTMCFFWIFPFLLKNPKNTMIFVGFSLVFIEKSKKKPIVFFVDVRGFWFWKMLEIQKTQCVFLIFDCFN